MPPLIHNNGSMIKAPEERRLFTRTTFHPNFGPVRYEVPRDKSLPFACNGKAGTLSRPSPGATPTGGVPKEWFPRSLGPPTGIKPEGG